MSPFLTLLRVTITRLIQPCNNLTSFILSGLALSNIISADNKLSLIGVWLEANANSVCSSFWAVSSCSRYFGMACATQG